MAPLTDSLPKPMLPVAGRPLVGHCLSSAIDAGASRVVIVVGHEAEKLRSYVADHDWPVDVEFAEQEEQRGTADAVRAAKEKLTDDPFVVLNGDALYDAPSLESLYNNGPAVGSYRVDDPTQYGVLDVEGADGAGDGDAGDAEDDESENGENENGATDGTVTGVIEKPPDPPSDLINTGAYVFPSAALSWLDVGESERGELELTDVLQRTCEEFDVATVPFDRWLDVGRPWELLEANEWKLAECERRLDGEVAEGAELRGTIVVERGATIEPGVVIEGPAYLDRGATVGPNAYVRGATYLGPDSKVGHSVEVKNSVISDGSHVPHLSYVGDSVLGRNVNLGAATTVANLRHDDENIRMTVKGESTDTGRRKFGVVCGDEVKTGIDTSLNAGVVLSTRATTKPGENVLDDR